MNDAIPFSYRVTHPFLSVELRKNKSRLSPRPVSTERSLTAERRFSEGRLAGGWALRVRLIIRRRNRVPREMMRVSFAVSVVLLCGPGGEQEKQL